MKQIAIIIVTIASFTTFTYAAIKASLLITELKREIFLPVHWSGRISIKELKLVASSVHDPSQQKKIQNAISLLKLSKSVIYVTFVIIVLLILS